MGCQYHEEMVYVPINVSIIAVNGGASIPFNVLQNRDAIHERLGIRYDVVLPSTCQFHLPIWTVADLPLVLAHPMFYIPTV